MLNFDTTILHFDLNRQKAERRSFSSRCAGSSDLFKWAVAAAA